jgi:hypothetical protein
LSTGFSATICRSFRPGITIRWSAVGGRLTRHSVPRTRLL